MRPNLSPEERSAFVAAATAFLAAKEQIEFAAHETMLGSYRIALPFDIACRIRTEDLALNYCENECRVVAAYLWKQLFIKLLNDWFHVRLSDIRGRQQKQSGNDPFSAQEVQVASANVGAGTLKHIAF
jgi:hypothetical protein